MNETVVAEWNNRLYLANVDSLYGVAIIKASEALSEPEAHDIARFEDDGNVTEPR